MPTPEETASALAIIAIVRANREQHDYAGPSPFDSVGSLMSFVNRCVRVVNDPAIEGGDILHEMAVSVLKQDFSGNHTLAYRRLFSRFAHGNPTMESIEDVADQIAEPGLLSDLRNVLTDSEFDYLFAHVIEGESISKIAEREGLDKRAVSRIIRLATAKCKILLR